MPENPLAARAGHAPAAPTLGALPEGGSIPSPWSRNSRFGAEGLEIAGVRATDVARDFGTPLMILDEDDFRARCRAFAAAFPRVLFAVKAFTSHFLIRIATEEGLGLLASTDGELQACLRAGADPAAISLHGNNKSAAELRLAVESEIGLVTVDNADELERLDGIAREHSRVQPVLLRVSPGVEGDTHAYLETGGLDSKFGMPIKGGSALEAIKRAAELDSISLAGLHAHVGSQLLSAGPYLTEIDRLFDLIAQARRDPGIDIRLVDCGGGFGVTYTEEIPGLLPEIASKMLDRVSAAAAQGGFPAPNIMVEPGRALVANAVCTVYKVGSIKTVPSGMTFVAVDGGMSDNIRPALYGAKYTVSRANQPRPGTQMRTVSVVGRHCESGDILAREIELPADLRHGDLLAFAATGAYGYSMASNYNRVGRPAVVGVRDGRSRLIFRREDAGDLDRLEVAFPTEPALEQVRGATIRAAEPKDAASFHRMWKEVVAEGLVRSQEVTRPVRHYKRLFRRSWTDRGAWIAAVTGEGDVVGFLSATREEHPVTSHVATIGLGVGKDWRGRGVGTALVAESFKWARAVGVEKILLSVYPSNLPAVALYRKFGFVEEGRMTGQSKKEGGYEDEILMGRWLA
jgi:diaminopimelate decarboxylase